MATMGPINLKLRLYFRLSGTFFVLISSFYLCLGQGNNLSVNTTVPTQVIVCNGAEDFTVSVNNISSGSVTNIFLSVVMPKGMNYVNSSVSGIGASEFNIDTPHSPIFSLPDLAPGQNIIVTFSAYADCRIIQHHNNGLPIVNTTSVAYIADGSSDWDMDYASSPYNISYASLSITNITNKTYSGSFGDVFTRKITITNGGIGLLTEFTLTDEHISGIGINSVSHGTISSSLSADTIKLSAADFITIGDGDPYFETEEVIEIIETIEIVSCMAGSVPSTIIADWGCNGDRCQGYYTSANVNINNANPYLDFQYNYPSDSCVGPNHAIPQELIITNTGLITATNIKIQIYQGNGGGFGDYIYSRFDENTFTITDTNYVTTTITPDSLYMNKSTGSYACLGLNPVGGVELSLPNLEPNEFIIINWETYNCCIDNCNNPGAQIGGWKFDGTYFDNCQQNIFYIGERSAIWPSSMWMNQTIFGPTDLDDGQTGLFTFTNMGLWVFSEINGAFLQMVFDLPAGLMWNGGINDLTYYGQNGTNWTAHSYSYNSNTLTINYAYPLPPGFQTYNAEIRLSLTVDCNVNGAGGMSNIGQTVKYLQSTSCVNVCESNIYCADAGVNIHCGDSCLTGGANFIGYEIKRINYGLPDNDDDGLADTTGSLNLNAIKTDRAIYGDTLKATFRGYVSVTGTNPTWAYGYARSDISWGEQLTPLSGEVIIYDKNTGIMYTGNAAINTPFSGTFTYDFSPSTLRNNGSAIPSNFVFEEDDSIILNAFYRVSDNLEWGSYYCLVTNEFYLSNVANPTNPGDMNSCDNYSGAFTLAGYGFNNCCNDYWSAQPCEDLSLYYYLGLYVASYGSGGNFFPYEYRNFGYPDKIKIFIPDGFTFKNAVFDYSRTAGSNYTFWDDIDSLSFDYLDNDTLVFDLNQYFKNNGGKFEYSDDGWYGNLRIDYSSDCSVADNKSKPFISHTIYGTSPLLTGSPTPSSFLITDSLFFNPPQMDVEASIQVADGINSIVSWDITIDKYNWNPINYFWLNGESLSGEFTIIEVLDINSSTALTSHNGVYHLGTLNNNKYRITASYSSCNYDSLMINVGWDCTGYPDKVDSNSCIAETYQLYVDPKEAELQMSVINPPGKVDLCETVEYSFEVSSVQIGTAYDVKARIVLPSSTGMSLVPGSSILKYPVSGSYTSVPDPVLVAPNTYEWDISAIDSTIDTNGLKGVLEPAINSLMIKCNLQTDCDYLSGGVIKFKSLATSNCGEPINDAAQTSMPLKIKGIPDYETVVQLSIDSSGYNCNDSTTIQVNIINLGPDSIGNDDHIYIEIPSTLKYVNGAFIGLNNPPVVADPVQTTVGPSTRLDWQLTSGLTSMSQVSFEFMIAGISNLSCNTHYISSQTFLKSDAYCVATGDSCKIGGITGNRIDSIVIIKPALDLSNLKIFGVPYSSTKEEIYINIDVTNNSALTSGEVPPVIEFYYDADGTDDYSAGDLLLGFKMMSEVVNMMTTITLKDTLLVDAGKTCRIIAVIDSSINCVCSNAELLISNIPLQAANADTSICSGEQITLGTKQMAGYSYNWSPVTGLDNPLIAQPKLILNNAGVSTMNKTYRIRVTKNGCTVTDSVNISVYREVAANFGYSDITCLNENISFVDSTPVNITNWNWNFGDGNTSTTQNPVHAYTAVGSYSVIMKVEDVNGCWDTIIKNIDLSNLPVAEAGNNIAICKGDTGLLLGSGGINFSWFPVLGLDCSTCPNPYASPQNTTTYFMTISDSNGCKATDSVTVVVHPLPISVAGDDEVICKSDSIILNGSGNGNYYWYPTTGLNNNTIVNPVASPQTTQTYILMVTDSNGCTSKDSVTINVETPYIMNAGPDAEICEGDETRIGLDGSAVYSWSPGATLNCTDCPQPIAKPASTTTYKVIGTKGVCPGDSDFVKVVVNPLPDFGVEDATIVRGEGTQLIINGNNDLTYRWTPSYGLSCNNCKTPIANPLETTTYFVTAVDSFGCSGKNRLIVNVTDNLCEGSEIFIANAFTPNNDNRNDKVCVRGVSIERVNIFRIYNRWGEKVFESGGFNANDFAYGWDGTYKGKKLNTDVFVYYVEIVCIGGNVVIKKGNITLIR